MTKRVFRGLSVMVTSLLCCGCAAKLSELSTNPQENSKVIHKESTLSTEESTNVDNTGDYTLSVLITYDGNEENRTGSGEASVEESANTTEESAETAAEVPSMNERETEVEPQSTAEEPELDENMKEVLSDAAYYYTFYASIYQSRDENTSLRFDQEAFQTAYESIEEENLNDYFSDISWLMREEGISLSFTPTNLMFPNGNGDVNLWMARCIHAFALIEEAYSTDSNWDHPDSLKPQFHCHTIYARQNKVPWNIEPYRTETSFLKVILSKGNPDS